MLFVCYLSKDCPDEYYKRRRLLAASIRYKQPTGYLHSLDGNRQERCFLEGIEFLRSALPHLKLPIYYLDADCILMEPIDFIFKEYDFDIGVIYRYKWNLNGFNNDLLGGFYLLPPERRDQQVLFFDKLIKEAGKLSEKENWWYDQQALYNILGPPDIERKKNGYYYPKLLKPQVCFRDGLKILYLDACQWACPMHYFPPEKIYMYHYNHSIWYKRIEKEKNAKPFTE